MQTISFPFFPGKTAITSHKSGPKSAFHRALFIMLNKADSPFYFVGKMLKRGHYIQKIEGNWTVLTEKKKYCECLFSFPLFFLQSRAILHSHLTI